MRPYFKFDVLQNKYSLKKPVKIFWNVNYHCTFKTIQINCHYCCHRFNNVIQDLFWKIGQSRTGHRGVSAVHDNVIVRENDRWLMRDFDIKVTILPQNIYIGRFIMFSLITDIYNNKTKEPNLMELFTAPGKLKSFLFF